MHGFFESADFLAAFLCRKEAQEILVICLQIGGVQPSQNLHLLAVGELERLKARKKKRRFMGVAQTRKLLKKLDQNFCQVGSQKHEKRAISRYVTPR